MTKRVGQAGKAEADAGDAAVQVLPLNGAGPSLPVLEGAGSARAVIWPGTGATERSVHLIQLGPLSGTVRLEHLAESVYYVLDGSGPVAAGFGSSAGRARTTRPSTLALVVRGVRAGNRPAHLPANPTARSAQLTRPSRCCTGTSPR